MFFIAVSLQRYRPYIYYQSLFEWRRSMLHQRTFELLPAWDRKRWNHTATSRSLQRGDFHVIADVELDIIDLLDNCSSLKNFCCFLLIVWPSTERSSLRQPEKCVPQSIVVLGKLNIRRPVYHCVACCLPPCSLQSKITSIHIAYVSSIGSVVYWCDQRLSKSLIKLCDYANFFVDTALATRVISYVYVQLNGLSRAPSRFIEYKCDGVWVLRTQPAKLSILSGSVNW